MIIQISIRHMIASLVNKKMILELCSEINNKYKSIYNIDVKIEDINGPHKAGIDKCCHLKVRGTNNLAFDIYDIDNEINYAIDNAFNHLNQILERHSCLYNRRLHNSNNNIMKGLK